MLAWNRCLWVRQGTSGVTTQSFHRRVWSTPGRRMSPEDFIEALVNRRVEALVKRSMSKLSLNEYTTNGYRERQRILSSRMLEREGIWRDVYTAIILQLPSMAKSLIAPGEGTPLQRRAFMDSRALAVRWISGRRDIG